MVNTLVSVSGSAALHEKRDPNFSIETQLLFGERVLLLNDYGEWLKVCKWFGTYRYEGYVRRSMFADCNVAATHRVWEMWTPIRSSPNLKAIVLDKLSIGSELRILDETEDQYEIWPTGWIFKEHVKSIEIVELNFVETIKRFIGTPFVWGGRSAFGFDCSGLFQLGLQLAGLSAPRRMIHMAQGLGRLLDQGEPAVKGDLIFYSQHCGMLVDDSLIINSNGKVGQVQIERLNVFHRRMQEIGGYDYVGSRRVASSSDESLSH